jgi:Cd2+/Zn2+-exporting ATPase
VTKNYTLKGLGCANCAARIERAVSVVEGVQAVTVSPVTTVLNVEFGSHLAGRITRLIEQAVRKHEPEIVVMDNDRKEDAQGGENAASDDAGGKRKIIRLIAGAVIFAAGMAADMFFAPEPRRYIRPAVFIAAYLILGGNVVLRALRNIARGRVFDENFLMSAATVGAFAIGEYPEAAGVMLFYQVGEMFQDAAVKRSKKSITGLMDIRPDYANLRQGGGVEKVAPGTVSVGDVIIVKPGEKIPLDGIVVEGVSMLDASALTGESVPRKVETGDAVLSGSVNQSGMLAIEVTKTFGESTVSKIIDLVENAAGKKAKTENFITAFARYYTPVVAALAALIAVLPPLIFGTPTGGVWRDWINRALVFLVISCPCALVLSIPMGFFAGIGRAARRGILVKGGNYLEAFNSLETVVFDKTGTLTKGVFKVTAVEPAAGFSGDTLLETAAHAEAFSNHPIALSVIKEYSNQRFGKAVELDKLSDYTEIAGHGVSVCLNGKIILAGNQKLMAKAGVGFQESQSVGTKVYVASGGVFAGCVVISDEIKPDSRNAISALKAKGVRNTVMLTGDNPCIAGAVAAELKLDEVYSGLLPHEKVERAEILNAKKSAKGKLAFVGDGINDAPVLAMADIGVAMGGLGSDAAIEAADVVLMTDEPSKLCDAIDIARFTKKIVWQNIVFALGVKVVFLSLGAFGVATMWEAVFADVGVSLLAILNAMRIMRIK